MLNVDDKVISDISRGFSVPAQPELLVKIQDLMAAPEPDLNVIASAISRDVAVSATVLKTINSPVYGLARSVSDIHKATRYIGLNGVTSLVTSNLIKDSFRQDNCSIPLEDFWDTSSNIASTSVFIGKSLKQAVSNDKLFSLGLFHDCGIPVMATKYQDYGKTYEHAFNSSDETLTSIEDDAYRVNHAILGYYVASSWRLPKDICQLILSHHDLNFLRSSNSRVQKFYFAILKMAENIVQNVKHFRDVPDWQYIRDGVYQTLGLDNENYLDLLEDSIEHQI